jgi:hypothetical protein
MFDTVRRIRDSVAETVFNHWDSVAETVFNHYVSNPMKWFTPTPDEHSVLLGLPCYRQVSRYSCAFVAGLIVLHYFFPARSAMAFWTRVGATPDDGAGQGQLVRALRRSGISVSIREDLRFEDITDAIDADRPVVVTVRRPETDHWVVIGGYARKPRRVYLFNDAWRQCPYCYSWKEFRAVWDPVGTGLVCRPKAKARGA